MRNLRRVLAAVLLTAGLSACGGTADDTAAPATSAPGAVFPVSIAHKFGATEIKAKPSRILTVGWNDQDYVLALGEVPVSTREWFDDYATYPWVAPKLQGKPLPAFSAEVNYEAI